MKRNLLTTLVLCTIFFIGCSSSDSIEESTSQTIKKDTTSTNIVDGRNITFTYEQLKLPGKKGACQKGLSKVDSLNAHWNYTWGSTYPTDQISTSEFIPMKWGGKTISNTFKETISSYIKAHLCKRILAVNEPDKSNQSNLTVEDVVNFWPELEAFGVPLGSPAVVNAESGQWLKDFMSKVDELGLRVDYICVHNYGGISASAFEKKLTNIYNKYKRPILVTEFAVADWNASSVEKNKYTPTQVLNFMKQVLPWMEKTDFVYGYAWFSFGIKDKHGTASALFDSKGNLTELGKYYSNFQGN